MKKKKINDTRQTSKTRKQPNDLNNEISFFEVKTAIKMMKNGVAHGSDGIVNEIIKKGGENITRLIWKLLNNCFRNEVAPEQWLMGIQHPLYKSGEKRDPLNYRGIMLLNVTSKLYESILEKRLDTWVEKKKIIKEGQGGFRKNRGCPDQIFTLSSILDKRKKKTTFCSYIDLKKAFDSIWRNGLWVKLWNMGIKGKFWRVLKDFYRKTCVTIRINGKF